jgi:hypothetical protein
MRSGVKFIVIACAVALAGVAFSPQPASAAKASITNTGMRQNGDLVTVHFRVEGAFTDKIIEAINSGALTTFRYSLRVYREVPNLMDERLLSYELSRTIRYDTLKQEYLIASDGEEWVFTAWDEAQRKMTRLTDLPVAVKTTFDGSSRYYVLVKADLENVDLPFFNFFRFLFSPWTFETPWTRIDYRPGETEP